jgi:hypothetical protein
MIDKTVYTGLIVIWPLFLLFLGLKLFGYISWSWWLVTIPLWGPLALIAASILFAVTIAALLPTPNIYL